MTTTPHHTIATVDASAEAGAVMGGAVSSAVAAAAPDLLEALGDLLDEWNIQAARGNIIPEDAAEALSIERAVAAGIAAMAKALPVCAP